MTNAYRGRGRRAYERQREALLRRTKASGVTSCPACGLDFDWDNPNSPQAFTADHDPPLAAGGKLLGPIFPLCRSCNGRKRDTVTPILRPAT